jgi:hypothetical protein
MNAAVALISECSSRLIDWAMVAGFFVAQGFVATGGINHYFS